MKIGPQTRPVISTFALSLALSWLLTTTAFFGKQEARAVPMRDASRNDLHAWLQENQLTALAIPLKELGAESVSNLRTLDAQDIKALESKLKKLEQRRFREAWTALFKVSDMQVKGHLKKARDMQVMLGLDVAG